MKAPLSGGVRLVPCPNGLKNLLCRWPRCQCGIDLVYSTKIHIEKPRKK